MARMAPKQSSLAGEEDNPKYHNNDRCPHYHELVNNGHAVPSDGLIGLCDWCKSN
jgi:hypothetical protein